MPRAGCNPHRPRRRHDVGDFVGGIAALRRADLHDAAGAIGQLRPGMRVRLEVRIGRQGAGAQAHRALPAGRETINVAYRHHVKWGVADHETGKREVSFEAGCQPGCQWPYRGLRVSLAEIR